MTDPIPPNVQALASQVRDKAAIVMMRRLLRARGHSTGKFTVTVAELDQTQAFELVLTMEEQGKFTFDLRRKK